MNKEFTALKSCIDIFLKQHEDNWQSYLLHNWHAVIGALHTKMRLEKIVGSLLVIGVYDIFYASYWIFKLN